MIGKFQLQLGAEQLVSGMASSDFATDGALATTSSTLNPFINPGIMQGSVNSSVSTNIAGNIIASCEDSNAVSPNNRYYIDDATNAANYYSFNGTSITKVKTGTATGTTYVKGKSDFISYNGFFYASAPTVLNKWDGTSGAGLTEAYKTFGDANAHHPLLTYQRLMWVGDGNTLSTLDSSATYTLNVLTLDPKEKIVALGIDPATGYMMISVQTVYDVSDSIPSLKAVYLYDGISSKPARKILVDDLITAFYNVEGNVYIGAGQTVGQWNGNGVTFLRKLSNVLLDNTYLPYKHNFSNVRNILFVANGTTLLSYGSVIGGQRKGWFSFGAAAFTTPITCVSPVGSGKVGISSANGGTYFLGMYDTTTAGSNFNLAFSNIYFPRPIFVRRMRIITTGIVHTGSTDITILILDEKGAVLPIANANRIISVPTGTTYVLDFDFTAGKCQGITPVINSTNGTWGFVRAIIYYDIAE